MNQLQQAMLDTIVRQALNLEETHVVTQGDFETYCDKAAQRDARINKRKR